MYKELIGHSSSFDCGLQLTLQASLAVKIGCRFHHQAIQVSLQSLLQIMRPLFSSDNVTSQFSNVTTGEVIISFALLPDLMSAHRITCRGDLGGRLLRKHILDREQFVEQLELLLSLETFLRIKLLSIELRNVTRIRDLRS